MKNKLTNKNSTRIVVIIQWCTSILSEHLEFVFWKNVWFFSNVAVQIITIDMLFHRTVSIVEGGKMAMQIGKYSQIRYDWSLSTSGMTRRKIPDAIGVARRGKNMLIEVVSKSQTRKQMEIKCQIMIANNYASYNVISWVVVI